MGQLVDVIMDTYGTFYPELKDEEESFSILLQRGIKYFTNLQNELQEKNKNMISGKEAFFMYDTLGFPIDLTMLMAEEAGLKVNENEFNNAMEEQKQRSRDAQKAAKNLGGNTMMDLGTEDVAILERLNIIKSNDEYK